MNNRWFSHNWLVNLGVIHKILTHGWRGGGGGGLSQCVPLCISKWMRSHKLRTWGEEGRGGEGAVKNPEKFAYVLYGWPLSLFIKLELLMWWVNDETVLKSNNYVADIDKDEHMEESQSILQPPCVNYHVSGPRSLYLDQCHYIELLKTKKK